MSKEKRPTNESFTPLGEVLDGIIERCRSDSQGGVAHLVGVWNREIGSPIADNARPFAVKGALLLVHVSSSAWLHQLRFLKNELLDKLNGGLHNEHIEEIKFKIGPL